MADGPEYFHQLPKLGEILAQWRDDGFGLALMVGIRGADGRKIVSDEQFEHVQLTWTSALPPEFVVAICRRILEDAGLPERRPSPVEVFPEAALRAIRRGASLS